MHTFTLKSIYSVNPAQPMTPVQPWAGSIRKHSGIRTEKLPSTVEEDEEASGQCEPCGRATGSGMDEDVRGHMCCPASGYLTLVHQSEPKGFKYHWFVVLPEEVFLMRTVHKHCCKAFADVSVYKQMDLAQGQVAFQKLSTRTKICVNFNALIPNAKGEKPKRLLLSSLRYFNNFTIPSGKKDCVN